MARRRPRPVRGLPGAHHRIAASGAGVAPAADSRGVPPGRPPPWPIRGPARMARQPHHAARAARGKADRAGMPASRRVDCRAAGATAPRRPTSWCCAQARPPGRDGGRIARAAHSGPAAREDRPGRSARGAGHRGAARRAGFAHARPVAGPRAEVAAVRRWATRRWSRWRWRRAGPRGRPAASWFELLRKASCPPPVLHGLARDAAALEGLGGYAAAARRAGSDLSRRRRAGAVRRGRARCAARRGAGQPAGLARARRCRSMARVTPRLTASCARSRRAASRRRPCRRRRPCACSRCTAPRGWKRPWCSCSTPTARRRSAETMGVMVEWPGEAPAPWRFAFLASETRPPACSAEALEVEKAARQREELNALYVAMTRARNRLVLSSVQPHIAGEASWWQRLQPFCTPLDRRGIARDGARCGRGDATERFVLPVGAAAHRPASRRRFRPQAKPLLDPRRDRASARPCTACSRVARAGRARLGRRRRCSVSHASSRWTRRLLRRSRRDGATHPGRGGRLGLGRGERRLAGQRGAAAPGRAAAAGPAGAPSAAAANGGCSTTSPRRGPNRRPQLVEQMRRYRDGGAGGLSRTPRSRPHS